jgi:hypothetical protein
MNGQIQRIQLLYQNAQPCFIWIERDLRILVGGALRIFLITAGLNKGTPLKKNARHADSICGDYEIVAYDSLIICSANKQHF